MAQWIHCSQCDQHYQFPDTAAGKQAACPKCGKLLAVGAPAPAVPAVPLPRAVPKPVREAAEPLWALPVRRDRREPTAGPSRQAPPAEAAAAAYVGVPNAYHHEACGGDTTISPDVVAWMTGDPYGFIVSTKCANCGRYVGLRAVTWKDTGETVAAYRKRLRRQTYPLLIALRLVVGPLTGALIGAAIGAVANLKNWDLGALAGVVIGLPLGYYVTGMAYQIGWAMTRKKR